MSSIVVARVNPGVDDDGAVVGQGEGGRCVVVVAAQVGGARRGGEAQTKQKDAEAEAQDGRAGEEHGLKLVTCKEENKR